MSRLPSLSRTVEARPRAYRAGPYVALRGPYARNERLAKLERFELVRGAHGPESIAVDRDGTLVAGFDDGVVRRFDPRGRLLEQVVNTQGRPLGLRFHPDGRLLVCDAKRGLLRVEREAYVTVLAREAEGQSFGFTDDLDVDPTGRFVYFTDASSRWRYGEHNVDVLEHRGHGRLLEHDLVTGHTRVLVRGLVFANGVTLGPDAAYVLVTETGACRVHRHHLKGPRAGETEVWLDGLPGHPDNIRFNGRDRFWLAIPAPRNVLMDLLAPLPLVRWGVIQLGALMPLPVARAGIVLCFDTTGRLVSNLQTHARGGYHYVTQVLEHGGVLYLSSLEEGSVARLPLGAALPS
jgi:sugar lactone lactonase YvrE